MAEWRLVARSTLQNAHDGWCAEAADINYEDQDLHCDHCGEKIPAAYGAEP